MSFPFGKNLKLTIDGGAHDPKLFMRLEGMPAGIEIPENGLLSFLSRRSPVNEWETARKETDLPVFTAGLTNDRTDGGVLTAYIENKNTDPSSYSEFNRFPRPSHADYPAVMKYGREVDLRGGGHFSGRLTVLTCTAGYIALQYLRQLGADVFAHVYSVGGIRDIPFDPAAPEKCPHEIPVNSLHAKEKMRVAMQTAKNDGDSLGGVIECAVTGLRPGLGEHMFASVEAAVSDAVFSVPSVKGIEFGAGFEGTLLRGSEYNDTFYYEDGKVLTRTNHCGGILGGMTNGMPLLFRAALKPVPSIAKEQDTVDLEKKENAKLTVGGRHDACIVFRAVPVIEAAAALACADLLLGEAENADSLEGLRRQIDQTDREIVSLLCARMEISKAVAKDKLRTGKPVSDPEREKRLLDGVKALSGENAPLAEEIYEVILRHSKTCQNKILEKER